MGEVRAKRAGRRAQFGVDGPIFLRLEGFDLVFALADETQRHRLHAARRTRARQFAPQNRREREAHEIVERAARQIGVDQLFVDLARIGDGIEHGGARDRVEDDPLDLGAAGERALLLQDFQHVPGNGFAFAVRVGRQDQLVRAFEGVDDVLDALLGPGVDLPDHGEVFVRLHRAVLGRQVADVAEARQHLIAGAQILIDGLGLGRGLDDEDVHADAFYAPHGNKANQAPVPGRAGHWSSRRDNVNAMYGK